MLVKAQIVCWLQLFWFWSQDCQFYHDHNKTPPPVTTTTLKLEFEPPTWTADSKLPEGVDVTVTARGAFLSFLCAGVFFLGVGDDEGAVSVTRLHFNILNDKNQKNVSLKLYCPFTGPNQRVYKRKSTGYVRGFFLELCHTSGTLHQLIFSPIHMTSFQGLV